MSKAKQVKNDVIAILEKDVDPLLTRHEFKRNKRSLTYKRKVKDALQELDFTYSLSPLGDPRALLHMYPRFTLKMPGIAEIALQLVADNKRLLVSDPELVFKQPITLFVPNHAQPQWYAYETEQLPELMQDVCQFLSETVFTAIDNMASYADIIALYESDYDLMLRAQHWYIYVIAAYCIEGNKDGAIEVVRAKFAKLMLKRKYASLYEYFDIT